MSTYSHAHELARLAARVAELEGMYETSHESRMHAEAVVRRLETELAAARAVIRLTTWESCAGACRRHGTEPTGQWKDFTDYGYYLVDHDTEEYVEMPIEGEYEEATRAAYSGMPHITAADLEEDR